MAKIDDIAKDVRAIKRTLEPGVKGKRTDGELARFIRNARNHVVTQVGKKVEAAAREQGKAEGLDDKTIQRIVDAVAAVSAEDVAEQLDITVKG